MKLYFAEKNSKKTQIKEKLIGSWCLDKNILKEFNSDRILKYHIESNKDLDKIFDHAILVYENFLNKLHLKLNNYHNTNHSLKFWRILIGPWLSYLIFLVIEKDYHISKINLKNLLKIDAHFDPSFRIPFDFDDYLNIHYSNQWSDYIYSNIISLKKNVKKNYIHEKLKFNFEINKKKLLTNFLSFFKFFSSNKYLEREYSIFKSFFNLFINKNSFYNFSDINYIKKYINISERSKNILFSNDDDIDDKPLYNLLNKLINQNIPILYLERFRENYEIFKKKLNKVNYENLFTKYPSMDDKRKLILSISLENKKKINVIQHGGLYGTSKIYFNEYHEKSIADNFLDWGWDTPTKKISIYRRHNSLRAKKNNFKKILIIATERPKLNYRIAYGNYSTNYLSYVCNLKYMLNSLHDYINKETYIRIKKRTKKSNSFNLSNLLKDEGVLIKEDSNINFISSIKNSRLNIITYNATTFLESFYYNIPTICYWDDNLYSYSSNFQKIIFEMKNNNLHFNDINKMVEFINSNYNNINEWWFSDNVQKNRNNLIKKYYNFKK